MIATSGINDRSSELPPLATTTPRTSHTPTSYTVMHRGSVARGYTVTGLCANALLLAGHGQAYQRDDIDNGGTSFVAEEMYRFYECDG